MVILEERERGENRIALKLFANSGQKKNNYNDRPHSN